MPALAEHQLKLAAELHAAVQELASRGLTHAAKWAAEQLVSLGGDYSPPVASISAADQDPRYMLARLYLDTKVGVAAVGHTGCAPQTVARPPSAAPACAGCRPSPSPSYTCCTAAARPASADALLAPVTVPPSPSPPAQEYRRAAHVLTGVPGAKPLFLRSYCLFLAGERRKE